MNSFTMAFFSLCLLAHSASAQEAPKKYQLIYADMYPVAADKMMNNIDRVLSAIPSEVEVSFQDSVIKQKNLRGGDFEIKSKILTFKVPVSAEEFAKGVVTFKKETKISNSTFATNFAASLTNIDRGVVFRPSGTVESRKLFPDIIFSVEFDPSKASNAAEVKEEILRDRNGDWPKVDRVYRLNFENYSRMLLVNPNSTFVDDAIPNEFGVWTRSYSEVAMDPKTKEPTVYFGEIKSFQVLVTKEDLKAGRVEFSKRTPAFEDETSAKKLAEFLSNKDLGIEVRAERVLNADQNLSGLLQIWTIDLTKATNYAEQIAIE